MNPIPTALLDERVAPGLASTAALVRAPVALATVRGLSAITLGWLMALTVGLLTWIVVVVSAALVPVFGIGLPLLALAMIGARRYGEAERSRLGAQLDVRLAGPPPVGPRPGDPVPSPWSRGAAALRDRHGWSAAAYAFISTLVTSVLVTAVAGLAGGALAAAWFPFGGRGTVVDEFLGLPWPVTIGVAAALAVVLLWAAALAAQYGGLLLLRLARTLLGPSPTDAAREQVRLAAAHAQAAAAQAQAATVRAEELTVTRAGAVQAADSERRRIERDLHDGAQQRLVALGVELGVARRAAATDPVQAAAALEHAHAEVKETLAELRDLVRGIHPAVLSDRGLDAALSALAARCPVPVRVAVDGELTAAGPAAQAAAYFVAAEALTNVAKHAQASSVLVTAAAVAGPGGACTLRLVIADDGRGGATTTAGTGLAGLAGRIAALDGTFDLDSPAGAGTRLTVELPCAS